MKLQDLLKDAYKDGMSLEDIEAALEGVELPAGDDAEIRRLKNALSKSNSEAADFKKKYQDRLSEEEKKEAERTAEIEKMRADLEALNKEKAINGYNAKFLGLGFAEDIASASASALASGDFDAVFAGVKKHMEATEKKIKADLLKGTPTPPGGAGSDGSVTKESFKKMSLKERQALFQTDPETVKTFLEG